MSYGEQQLLKSRLMADANANRNVPTANASMYRAELGLQGQREGMQTREQLQQQLLQYKQQHDEMANQLKQLELQIKGSKLSRPAGGNSEVTPDGKAGLAQLNSVEKQIQQARAVVLSPTHGIEGITLAPEQVAGRVKAAQDQIGALSQQRDAIYQQYPQLRGHGATTQPAAGQGTAAQGAPPSTPSFSVPSQSQATGAGLPGPLRIYQSNEMGHAPQGSLIQHANGNVYKVLQASPDGTSAPKVDSNPIQLPATQAASGIPIQLPPSPLASE